MPIKVFDNYTDFSELEKVMHSKQGSDLPDSVHQVIKAMRVGLLNQCPDVKVMPLHFTTSYRRVNPGPIQSFSYDGTLSVDSSWRIQDGIQSTPYDSERVVKIRFRDFGSVAGVDFKGHCEKNPVIQLGLLFQNKTEATFYKEPSLGAYSRLATTFTEKYKKECPAVESIRYSVTPLPKGRECASGTDCYLHAAKTDGWSVNPSNITLKKQRSTSIVLWNNYGNRLS